MTSIRSIIISPSFRTRGTSHLPSETFLVKVNRRLLTALSDRTPNIVTKTTSATDTDRHCTDLLGLLCGDESANVGLAGEHLDGSAGGVDLLGALGAGNEEQNAEAVTSFLHRQDLSHPGTNPFKVLRALEDPHKDNFAGSTGVVGVSSNKLASVRHSVRDANTGSKQHDMTIRLVRVGGAVGTLDECVGKEPAIGSILGLLPKGVGETGAATNDQRHGSLASGQYVESVCRQLLAGEILFLLTPGDGERVASPHADRRHVEIQVLTGTELPRTSHAKGDSDGFASESFDLGLGTAATDIVADQDGHASGALEDPDDNDAENQHLLRQSLEMDPNSHDGDDGQYDVDMKESLVEGVTDDRR